MRARWYCICPASSGASRPCTALFLQRNRLPHTRQAAVKLPDVPGFSVCRWNTPGVPRTVIRHSPGRKACRARRCSTERSMTLPMQPRSSPESMPRHSLTAVLAMTESGIREGRWSLRTRPVPLARISANILSKARLERASALSSASVLRNTLWASSSTMSRCSAEDSGSRCR